MNPNKSPDEIMYDAIADLFKVVQGQPSMAKLEQVKRTAKIFASALDIVSERACINVFERLQSRVHKAFVGMEKDLSDLDSRVSDKQKEMNEKINQFEGQVVAARKLVGELSVELRKLDNLFKGIAV